MQCFKGAWISNILHDGIGIPRLNDAGGNQTITGGEVGDTGEEATRRAKEKGLISKKHSHFQSVDTIGETAVSWTLGKMVIEASKAVLPHGYELKSVGTHSRWSKAWTSGRGRLSALLGLPRLESKLDEYGIDAFWLYLMISLVVVALGYSILRRRLWLARANLHRRRKQSDAGAVRDWLARRSQSSSSGEDGFGSGSVTPRKGFFAAGRFKPFAYRLSAALGRITPTRNSGGEYSRPRTTRQMSSPGYIEHLELPAKDEVYSSSTSLSVPSSPRPDAFFIPALAGEQTSGYSSEIDIPSVETTPRGTPSRLGVDGSRSLSLKSSSNSLRKSVNPLKLSILDHPMTNGWNDPPPSVFGAPESRISAEANNGSSLNASGGVGRTLSRSSSRLNLQEHGMSLAARPVSRGPGMMDDPGGP